MNPLRYGCIVMLLLGAAPAVLGQTPSLVGDWRGTFTAAAGSTTLTLRTRLEAQAQLNSTIELHELKVTLAVLSTAQEGSKVSLDMPFLGARYEATLSADGAALNGQWIQPGTTTPLTLQRLAATAPVRDSLAEAAAARATTDWVRTQAIPLVAASAGSGFADLQALKPIIGDARVVALGEATHGTREFFQLKHRMLEFLVQEMGFTTFAIEASLPDVRRVNDYVLHGTGDPAAAVNGMLFWTWKTQEVLGMVQWMRAYNADPAHRRKVSFHGFDMQSSAQAVANLLAYLRTQDAELATRATQWLLPLGDEQTGADLRNAAAELKQQLASAIDTVLQRLDRIAPAAPLPGAVPTPAYRAWREARQDAVVIRQLVYMNSIPGSGNGERDQAMAANVQWILDTEGPQSKVVLWAHNAHVSTARNSVLSHAPMGWHLRNQFGPQLVVIGFAFNQGAFQAIGPLGQLREFKVGPAPTGSLDATMAAAGIPLFALDLRTASGPVGDWLRATQKTRSIGATFAPALQLNLVEQQTALAFDVLLFVDQTTRARPLPGTMELLR